MNPTISRLSLASATFYLAPDGVRHYKKTFNSNGNIVPTTEYKLVKWGTSSLIKLLTEKFEFHTEWEQKRITKFFDEVKAANNAAKSTEAVIDYSDIL